jgi:uncharacterized membrane protein
MAEGKPRQVFSPGPRLRLAVSAVAGTSLGLALPATLGETVRALLGWDGAVIVYLLLMLGMVLRSNPDRMRRRAAQQDQGRWLILAAILAGALFSMLALAFVQKSAKAAPGGEPPVFLLLVAGTIFLSWFLVHAVFTLHYAHAYYGPATDLDDADGLIGGLEFPEEKQPDYWDFMYFSFVVGMTCQVSDVQISGRGLRRLALMHGIVSFVFNTIILALTINVVASAI